MCEDVLGHLLVRVATHNRVSGWPSRRRSGMYLDHGPGVTHGPLIIVAMLHMRHVCGTPSDPQAIVYTRQMSRSSTHKTLLHGTSLTVRLMSTHFARGTFCRVFRFLTVDGISVSAPIRVSSALDPPSSAKNTTAQFLVAYTSRHHVSACFSIVTPHAAVC